MLVFVDRVRRLAATATTAASFTACQVFARVCHTVEGAAQMPRPKQVSSMKTELVCRYARSLSSGPWFLGYNGGP